MNNEQYLVESERTEVKFDKNTSLSHGVMILLDEMFRRTHELDLIADMLKKHLIYGKQIDLSQEVFTATGRVMSDLDSDTWEEDSTSVRQTVYPILMEFFHCGLGKLTEAIEFIEQFKGTINGDKLLDMVNLDEEMGDGWWYDSIYLRLTQQNGDTIRQINIDKLRVRYPEKFSDHQAEHRDLDKERKVLEKGSNTTLVR